MSRAKSGSTWNQSHQIILPYALAKNLIWTLTSSKMEIYSWGRTTGPESSPRWKKELIAVSLARMHSPQGSWKTSYWDLHTLQHWGPDRSIRGLCLCSPWPALRNPWGRRTLGGAPQSPISPVIKVSLKRLYDISLTEKAPEFEEVGARTPELLTALGTPNLSSSATWTQLPTKCLGLRLDVTKVHLPRTGSSLKSPPPFSPHHLHWTHTWFETFRHSPLKSVPLHCLAQHCTMAQALKKIGI